MDSAKPAQDKANDSGQLSGTLTDHLVLTKKNVSDLINVKYEQEDNNNNLTINTRDCLATLFDVLSGERQTKSKLQKLQADYPCYGVVSSLAFRDIQGGFFIKCISGCVFEHRSYETPAYSTLKQHLTLKHANQRWNGFCSACCRYIKKTDDKQPTLMADITPEITQLTLIDELYHLVKRHTSQAAEE